jgi:hypothetical protein
VATPKVKDENKQTESKEVLFPPNFKEGRYFLTDLRKEYPELNTIDEFKELKTAEMYFVWLYACPTSPLANTDLILANRRQRAVRAAFIDQSTNTVRVGYSEELYNQYMAGVYSEEVNMAIRRMEMFNPNIRYKAKILAETTLNNFMEFVNKDVSEIVETDERKKYVDMCDKILDALPKLIEKVETGYGIKTVVQKTGIDGVRGKTLMDIAHEEERKEND